MAAMQESGARPEPVRPSAPYTLGFDLWLVFVPLVLALALAAALVLIS